MRSNSNKLVNQDMDVVQLEEMNLYAECILRQVAENMHDSKLMSPLRRRIVKKRPREMAAVSNRNDNGKGWRDCLRVYSG